MIPDPQIRATLQETPGHWRSPPRIPQGRPPRGWRMWVLVGLAVVILAAVVVVILTAS
jgi:hypothetical protein